MWSNGVREKGGEGRVIGLPQFGVASDLEGKGRERWQGVLAGFLYGTCVCLLLLLLFLFFIYLFIFSYPLNYL